MLNLKNKWLEYSILFFLLTAPCCSLKHINNSVIQSHKVIQSFYSDGIKYVKVDEREYGMYIPEAEYIRLRKEVEDKIEHLSRGSNQKNLDKILLKEE